MTSYWEKLRDPRWQRVRLEIMHRDEFTCLQCGDKKSTLNVHHRAYARNRDPWDYPANSLVTLCEPCHANETDASDAILSLLLAFWPQAGADSGRIAQLSVRIENARGLEVGGTDKDDDDLSDVIALVYRLWATRDDQFDALLEQAKSVFGPTRFNG